MANNDKDRSATDSRVSRRRFLGVAGAGAAAATVGGFSNVRAESVPVRNIPEHRTDVVVAGAGMGGLTAAVRAQSQGADVFLLEKAEDPGGTMRESAGTIHGGVNSYEEMREVCPWGDAGLQRALAEGLPQAYSFYDSIDAPIGPPTDSPLVRNIGRPPVAFSNFLVNRFESQGGTLLTETPLLRLVKNAQDEVIGVVAEGPDGPVRILANAVILATGGWAGNAEMVHRYITREFQSLHQRNCGYAGLQPPLTGDGLWAATNIGAALSDGGFDSFYGHLLPARPAQFTHPLIDYSLYHGQWCVALNVRGERFTDESRGKLSGWGVETSPSEQAVNVEAAYQPDAAAAYIWDHEINESQARVGVQVLGDIDKYDAFRQAGAPVARADTLEDLADQMERWGRGMPAEKVLRELTEYNEAARNGRAAALPIPKEDPQYALPLGEPPYYAVLGQTGITGSYGALKANPQGQVLSRTTRPIPGLYAAGIDIGNIAANSQYLGFLGYGAAFGYISGTNAANYSGPRGGWDIASS